MSTRRTTPHLDDVRTELLAALRELRDRSSPMDPDRARDIAQVGNVLIESAKVEVDYLRITKQDNAPFLEAPPDIPAPPTAASGHGPILTGLVGVTTHRLRG